MIVVQAVSHRPLGGQESGGVHPQGGLTAVAFRPEQRGPEDLIAAVSSAGHDGKHYYSAELLDMRPARTT